MEGSSDDPLDSDDAVLNSSSSFASAPLHHSPQEDQHFQQQPAILNHDIRHSPSPIHPFQDEFMAHDDDSDADPPDFLMNENAARPPSSQNDDVLSNVALHAPIALFPQTWLADSDDDPYNQRMISHSQIAVPPLGMGGGVVHHHTDDDADVFPQSRRGSNVDAITPPSDDETDDDASPSLMIEMDPVLPRSSSRLERREGMAGQATRIMAGIGANLQMNGRVIAKTSNSLWNKYVLDRRLGSANEPLLTGRERGRTGHSGVGRSPGATRNVNGGLSEHPPTRGAATSRNSGLEKRLAKAREEAERIWFEVENVDDFLVRIYQYYEGKGIRCILLSKFTNLIILAFTVLFSTFLFTCIDHSLINEKKRLNEVIYSTCFQPPPTIVLIFGVWWAWQLVRLFFEIPQLSEMEVFFTYMLEIPEIDLETIPWREIVVRLGTKKPRRVSVQNFLGPNNPLRGRMFRGAAQTTRAPATQHALDRLDAHQIANRIMRKENYMIAIFNKDLLDLSMPYLPETWSDVIRMFGGRWRRHQEPGEQDAEGSLKKKRQWVTQNVEWNLNYCILRFVFDERGRVRKRFLKEENRAKLTEILRSRFITMGYLNLVFAPFMFILLIMLYFFRYAEEYSKNPSKISVREYSRYAYWKFREFNELPHFFVERLRKSYEKAYLYVQQGPREKMAILARFVTFIAGSFAAVLAVFALFDEELLRGFEITPGRSALFYFATFGTILAVARGMIPDEQTPFEPERLLREVIQETHYLPEHWREKLHTDEVRQQFSALYDVKLSLFLQELISVLLMPFILWYSLANCSEAIVDFFREFTVHVDGVGYVCSFAVFDFRRHGNAKYGAGLQGVGENLASREGKMEHSFINFKAQNPDWEPDMEGSTFLTNVLQRRGYPAEAATVFGATPGQAGPSRFPSAGMERLHPFQAGAGSVHVGAGGSMMRNRIPTGVSGWPQADPLMFNQSPPGPRGFTPMGLPSGPGDPMDAAGSIGESVLESTHNTRDMLGQGMFALLDAIYERFPPKFPSG